MNIQLEKVRAQESNKAYCVVLVEDGLKLVPIMGLADAIPDGDSRLIPFAEIGQMDYDGGVLHLQTEDEDSRFVVTDSPLEAIDLFIKALQEALNADYAAEADVGAEV